MSFIHNSITLGQFITPVIEDPNLANGRIFLSSIGHDSNYLTPIFSSVYHYQTSATINVLQPNGFGNFSSATTVWGGNLLTVGGSIWTGRAADSSTNSSRDAWVAYHRSLDPINYPAKRSWYTVNNRTIITLPYQDLYNNTIPSYNTYLVYGTDITTSTGAIFSTSTNNVSVLTPNNLFFEDSTNNRLWGISTSNGNNEYIGFMSSYDTNPPVSRMNTLNYTNGTGFFLGPDTTNNTYWVVVQDNAVGDPYSIYRMVSSVSNLLSIPVVSSGNTVAWNHCWPSNVRYDSATQRVFYSSHFDGGNNLVPVRFRWDPTQAAGVFTSTTCTMTYGTVTAAGSYTFYAAKYALTGGGTNGDGWHIQPQQFQPAGTSTWYLTFWLTDKANLSANAPTRWSTAQQRTMMTYAVTSTNTDSLLTFHSAYTFSGYSVIPRDWLPISADGTQVVVPTSSQTNFFTFNQITGWTSTNVYPYEFVSVGLDQQNRLWGVGKESSGYYSVHLITPTIPVNVTVTLSGQNFTYTGTNITTTATIKAFNSSGTAIVSTLTLGIVGTGMVFAANNTTSYTTTTNTTTGALVNLTINGSGINNIIIGASI
jgi:hypothetical protein